MQFQTAALAVSISSRTERYQKSGTSIVSILFKLSKVSKSQNMKVSRYRSIEVSKRRGTEVLRY